MRESAWQKTGWNASVSLNRQDLSDNRTLRSSVQVTHGMFYLQSERCLPVPKTHTYTYENPNLHRNTNTHTHASVCNVLSEFVAVLYILLYII